MCHEAKKEREGSRVAEEEDRKESHQNHHITCHTTSTRDLWPLCVPGNEESQICGMPIVTVQLNNSVSTWLNNSSKTAVEIFYFSPLLSHSLALQPEVSSLPPSLSHLKRITTLSYTHLLISTERRLVLLRIFYIPFP